MEIKESSSARSRVVNSYFETTSQSSQAKAGAFEGSAANLFRGLGDWFDVEGKDVLDLGCGTGQLCWLAQAHGAKRVVGVNLSFGELQFARDRVEAEFVQQDVLRFLTESEDSSFDRIFAMNLLEHLDADVLVGVLEQSRRVLRCNGTLIAMVPNAISPFGGMTRYWDVTHVTSFTPSSVRQLVKLSGFKEATFREWGPRAHGLVSGIRTGLWYLIRAGISFRLLVETGSAKGGVYTSDMLLRLHC